MVREGIRRIAQALFGERDHLVADIHAVDLGEVAAQRPQQPARAAADFERRVTPAEALQIQLQALGDVAARGKKLLVILLAAAEGYIVVGVFAGAVVPIRAHAL